MEPNFTLFNFKIHPFIVILLFLIGCNKNDIQVNSSVKVDTLTDPAVSIYIAFDFSNSMIEHNVLKIEVEKTIEEGLKNIPEKAHIGFQVISENSDINAVYVDLTESKPTKPNRPEKTSYYTYTLYTKALNEYDSILLPTYKVEHNKWQKSRDSKISHFKNTIQKYVAEKHFNVNYTDIHSALNRSILFHRANIDCQAYTILVSDGIDTQKKECFSKEERDTIKYYLIGGCPKAQKLSWIKEFSPYYIQHIAQINFKN